MELTEILPQIRVDKTTKSALQEKAKETDRSLSSHIRYVLKLSIEQKKQQK